MQIPARKKYTVKVWEGFCDSAKMLEGMATFSWWAYANAYELVDEPCALRGKSPK
jgi:hypothetical protein